MLSHKNRKQVEYSSTTQKLAHIGIVYKATIYKCRGTNKTNYSFSLLSIENNFARGFKGG